MKILTQEIAARTKREVRQPWPLEKLLYGGGISKAKRGKSKNQISSDLEKFICCAVVASRNYLQSALYPTDNTVDPIMYGKPDMARMLSYLEKMSGLFDRVRVRKDRIGKTYSFSLSFPVLQVSASPFSPLVGTSLQMSREQIVEGFATKAMLFSSNFFDVERPLDLSVPVDVVLSNFTADSESSIDVDAYKREFRKFIKSFRIIAPSITVAEKARHTQFTIIGDDNVSIRPLGLDEPQLNLESARSRDNRQQFIINAASNRTLTVYVSAIIPAQMALGITDNSKLEEVKLHSVASWFKNAALAKYGSSDADMVDSIVDISRISERNKTSAILDTERTNIDGLSISRNGSLYYLPMMDSARAYEDKIEADNLREDGDFCLNDNKNPENIRYVEEPQADGSVRRRREYISKQPNKILYTDLKYGRLSYTDTNGTVQVMSIEDWRPVNEGNIYRIMSAPITLDPNDKSKASEVHRFLVNVCAVAIGRGFSVPASIEHHIAPDSLLYHSLAPITRHLSDSLASGQSHRFLALAREALYFAMVNKRHRFNDTPLTETEQDALHILEMNRGSFTLDMINPNSPFTPLRVLYDAVKHYYDAVSADIETAFSDKAVTTNMRVYAAALIVIKYGGKEQELRAVDEQRRKEYINPDPVDINSVGPEVLQGIPFIRGKKNPDGTRRPFTLMPHQVKAWMMMRNMPDNIIYAVSAGGGKTLLAIMDILWMMGNKKLQGKALVMCPGHLVKQYFSDVAYATGGTVNVVAITSDTMKAWGEDKLAYTIQNAPINTIFITDYAFLSMTKAGTMSYGNRPIQIVYAAEFLRRFKWAGLWLDECVSGDTLIRTNKGLVRLDSIASDLKIGQRKQISLDVLTEYGINESIMVSRSRKLVKRVVTQEGYFIKATDNHPVRVLEGINLVWKRIEDLQIGDVLCVQKKHCSWPVEQVKLNYGQGTPEYMTPDLARLCGYLVSEGHLTTGTRIEFSNLDRNLRNDCAGLVRLLFGKEAKVYPTRVLVHSKSIQGFFEYLGMKKKSGDMEIPWAVLQSNKKCVVEFLRAYYEGDGSVCTKAVIATSKSLRLIRQIQILLLNFGIVSSYRKLRKDGHKWYNLNIKGESYVNIYTSEIGFISRRKTDRLNALKNSWSKHYYEPGIPVSTCMEVSTVAEQYHVGGGLYSTGYRKIRGGPFRHLREYRCRTLGNYPYTRLSEDVESGRIAVFSEKLDSSLRDLSDLEFHFSPVKSITQLGLKDVYDIEVPATQSFVANGLVIHNCHYLKNEKSLRTKAVARLIAGIPYKRQMTGTYAPDTHKDIAGQFGLLDPTVFGTEDDFLATYWNEDNKSWVPGAGRKIRTRMSQYAKYVNIKRAEWAAFLPPRRDPENGQPTERFIGVELSESQRAVYDAILAWMQTDLNARVEANPKLRALIEKIQSKEENTDLNTEQDGRNPDDAEAQDDGTELEEFEAKVMEQILGGYVQRLEQFLTAPASDEAGKGILLGDDAVSPKAKAVAQIIREHLDRGFKGKVLIFTQYVESGLALYESMPPDIKSRCIHYVADTDKRDSILREFQVNDNLMAMMGCEKSLNTGLNLQFCFPEQTPIMIDRESCLTIKDVYENDAVTHVLSYDLKKRRIESRKILRKVRTKVVDSDSFVSVRIRDNLTGVESTLVCTGNHPFILKGGAVIDAEKLEAGSQLVAYGREFTRKKLDKVSGLVVKQGTVSNVQCKHCADIMHPNAVKKHLAEAHGKLNPEHQDHVTEAVKTFYNSDRPERALIDLSIPNLKYTGDGAYFITLGTGDKRVVKNPDFVSLNHMESGRTTRVVEVIGARDYTGRDAKYDSELKRAYKKAGIECLIIDAEDCTRRPEKVKSRLDSFINNHYCTVMGVKHTRNANVIGKYKYDLEIEGNHNFFACTTENRGGRSGYVPKTPILVHNCSRLIRVESVWNWGTLEQGESRVNRPNPKAEFRDALFFDWVYANRTLDVTKLARLISKCVESSKFNEADDARYQDLPQLPMPKMSPKTIFSCNDAQSLNPKVGLKSHFDTFQLMRVFEEAQYEEYRNNPSVRKMPLEVPEGDILEGSGMLKEIPYVADMQLYTPPSVSLIPYIDYASRNGGLVAFDPMHSHVHTEFGDGVVVKVARDSEGKAKALRIRISDGEKKTIAISKVWIINSKNLRVSQRSVRENLANAIALEAMGQNLVPEVKPKALPTQPIETEELDVEPEAVPVHKKPVKRIIRVKRLTPTVREPEPEVEEVREDQIVDIDRKANGFDVEVVSIMEALCLYVESSDPNVPANSLRKEGWVNMRPTASFVVRRPAVLQAWWQKVQRQFTVPDPFFTMMENAIEKMLAMPKKAFLSNITSAEFRNYQLMEHRPAKPGQVKPYLLVQSHAGATAPTVMVAIDQQGNREWRNLSRIRVPGMEAWEIDDGSGLYKVFKQRAEAVSYAKTLKRKFNVTNLPEVLSALRSIYVMKHAGEEEDWV